MPEAAITLAAVTKRYRLYSSVAERVLDVLGLSALRFGKPARYAEHPALDGIDLEVAHGERVGIIGRNGAGKTTLLKLIAGNFAPTAGAVRVAGRVQALLSVGLGFHPEFTGLENIRSALTYNGLPEDAIDAAVAEVAEFAELGEYLDQPIRTYSQGMQARLMFAAATAIRPDILIVDEVLGAGDAYFSAKSARRMRDLAESGCTLLLVSHSMQQVLQFCDRAVWLEQGRVVMNGAALDVVRAYEEFTERLHLAPPGAGASVVDSAWFRQSVLEGVLSSQATSGISRWPGSGALRIASAEVRDAGGLPLSVARTGEQMEIRIDVTASCAGVFPLRIAVLLFSSDGRPLSRHLSNPEKITLAAGQTVSRSLVFPEIRLGNGEYVFSAAIFEHFEPAEPATARRYDLLSRSFTFRVRDWCDIEPSLFHHPALWR